MYWRRREELGSPPRRDLFEELFVQRQVRSRSAQLPALLLELLQTAKLIDAHPGVLLAPAVKAILSDLEPTDRARHRQALAVHDSCRPPQVTISSGL